MRRHPISGYNAMHRGVDFSAPTGTPIIAAGSGTIKKAGWLGSYGRYVQIRHNGTYSTAYAHMSRIAKGVTPGARVQQGQVIGYVGSSGRSTGPHLHYEILVNNRKVNPLTVSLPTGEKIDPSLLPVFKRTVGLVNNEVMANGALRYVANDLTLLDE
jgi:murein DD-endopeptidase MepM/ murein hydrolase activator NlpD